MLVSYSKASPYYGTPLIAGTQFLDVMTKRPITRLANDKLYTIDVIYNLRPDILAFDLYGNAALWWVFAARNPNSFKDPLFDFVTGNTIYLPSKATLTTDLGL